MARTCLCRGDGNTSATRSARYRGMDGGSREHTGAYVSGGRRNITPRDSESQVKAIRGRPWLSLIWKRAKRANIASQRTRRFRAARPDPSPRKGRLLGMTILRWESFASERLRVLRMTIWFELWRIPRLEKRDVGHPQSAHPRTSRANSEAVYNPYRHVEDDQTDDVPRSVVSGAASVCRRGLGEGHHV